MSRTNIEWCVNEDGTKGWTVNPVKGMCPMDCKDLRGQPYCYARRLYQRFGWNPEVRYVPAAFDEVMRQGGPGQRIFVGSTMELFGPWVPRHVMLDILENVVGPFPQRTFIFLTKRPQELEKYNPWPENCWVGFSATDWESFIYGGEAIQGVQARVRFVSFEPLLGPVRVDTLNKLLLGLDWVIIGQKTPVRDAIPARWVADISGAAEAAGVPVFEKDNLREHCLSRTLRRRGWPVQSRRRQTAVAREGHDDKAADASQ